MVGNLERTGAFVAWAKGAFYTEIEGKLVLFDEDNIPSDTARNLALKIIDFERDLYAQRQIYFSQTSPTEDSDARSKRIQAVVTEVDMMVEHLSEPDL